MTTAKDLPNHYPDDALIRDFLAGDKLAFESLYSRHKDQAFFFAFTLTGSEPLAEETVQEAFIGFLRNIHSYRANGSFRGYILAAVRSRVIDAKRKKQRRRETPLDDKPNFFAGNGNLNLAFSAKETRLQVTAALLELPPEQREVIVLKIFDNMTFREIAKVTGESENTIASRYRYASAKLKITAKKESPNWDT